MRAKTQWVLWLSLTLAACGGSSQGGGYVWRGLDEATGQQVSYSQGPMPEGQSFTGVYRSPQIGDVQLVQNGDSVVGVYEYDRANCHVRGRVEGSAHGNLMKFNWREDHRACGRLQPITGRGYFIYQLEHSEVGNIDRGRLFGRWGLGTDDGHGDQGHNPWVAFKLPGRTPEINEAIGGGSGGSGGSAGDADGGT